jgi:hypothetical protein
MPISPKASRLHARDQLHIPHSISTASLPIVCTRNATPPVLRGAASRPACGLPTGLQAAHKDDAGKWYSLLRCNQVRSQHSEAAGKLKNSVFFSIKHPL